MSVPAPAPIPVAPPKRWPWLLLASVVGALAIFVLFTLHAREQRAEGAEQQAALFAAELRTSVREITLFGERVPPDQLAVALRPVILATSTSADDRLHQLDRRLGDDRRLRELQRELRDIGRLAQTTNDSLAFAERLSAAAIRMAGTADAIAASEHDRASMMGRESMAGGALAILIGLGIVVLVLQRAQRLLVVAGQRQARQLRDLAERDPLTGLANRRRLNDDLTRLAGHVSAAAPVQVLICDLDGFKALNDTLGHEAGDDLLVRFAQDLRAAAGDGGEAYRLGGDEFCVLSRPGLDIAGHVRRVVAGHGADAARGSAGMALWPDDAPTAREAMRLADERMYAAKPARRAFA